MPIDNLSKITSRTGISTTILLEAGNVRIGDNVSYSAGSGSDDLVIGATTGQHGMTILTGNNSSSINFADSGSTNLGAITYNHNGTNYMQFRVAGSTAMFLQSGSVGIGLTNPQTALHIRQTTDNNTDGFRISRANSNATYSQFINGVNSSFNIGFSNPSTADPDPQITL